MSERPSLNGADPDKRRSPWWEQVASFSTTLAFVFVALYIEQPLFFLAAGFAAVTVVAGMYRGRYPREAGVAVWVGRVGMAVVMLVVAAILVRGG